MNRIARKFKELRAAKKKAFIAFVTAGYPSLAATRALMLEFEKAGVDLIELGVPFSDPLADGPVIQAASQYALKRGTTLAAVLATVREARRAGVRVPVCLMTYFNPVFRYGVQDCARAACQAGVDGMIIPDLPYDEEPGVVRAFRAQGIDPIFFVSPTTDRARAARIARTARGFIYYVSLTGVTGARSALPAGIGANIAALKRLTRTPVCVGFGVSTPRHVAEVQGIADGVIVGSAIVSRITETMASPGMTRRVGDFVRDLRGGKKPPSGSLPAHNKKGLHV